MFNKIPTKKTFYGKHFLAVLNVSDEVKPVVEVATALAEAYKGKITAVNFVVLPYVTPLSVGVTYSEGPSKNLRTACQYHSQNSPVDCLLLLSHNRRKTISNTTYKKKIDFVIGSYQGFMDIYKNLKEVLTEIPANTMILQPISNKNIGDYRRIIVPFLKSPHTPLAVDTACILAKAYDQKMTILHNLKQKNIEKLCEKTLNRLDTKPDSISMKKTKSGQNSIISRILKEVREDTWLILPAYKSAWWTSILPRSKQGNLFEKIIRRLQIPVMIVKKKNNN